jgi:hypothetical protein
MVQRESQKPVMDMYMLQSVIFYSRVWMQCLNCVCERDGDCGIDVFESLSMVLKNISAGSSGEAVGL